MSGNPSFRCPDCGHDTFDIPESDDEQVVCLGCNAELGTKRQCLDDMEKAAQDAASDVFGKFGGKGGFTKPRGR
ncbi:hypothetical protein R3F64_01420 [Halomonas sp. 5021]|uniref:ECs_2282 family putative zinc-binding protein n=1 Tax=Halomonas sp. 5021 TaxID=3082156 RepID=UPI002FCC72C9